MKLRNRIKFLNRAIIAMERMAKNISVGEFSALSTRSAVRRLRLERPAKRRARNWTKSPPRTAD